MNLHDAKRAFLDTRYDPAREDEAWEVLRACPALASATFDAEDASDGKAIPGSTALHYAANDGRLALIRELLALGADVNAAGAEWYRTPLSWAANNARVQAIDLLLEQGADPTSLDALHAAAWGGSRKGQGREADYRDAIERLVAAGADPNDRRNPANQSPLEAAEAAGHATAIATLRKLGASS